ncbi:MAG: SGNH/GDSL hydrolase family protein [Clostridia bacterium]
MKKRVLCFGDSNTYGYDPMDGGRYDEDVRWPMVMQNLLGDAYRVIEEGLNGRTFSQDDPTEGGFKSGMAYLPPCLMTHNPLDLVIVMLGTNDTKVRFALSAGVIAHNLNQFVRLTRFYAYDAKGKAPKVLVVAPPAISENVGEALFGAHFGAEAAEKSRGFALNYRRYAKLLNCPFFNAAEAAEPCKVDGIHLMPEAQRALGAALAEKVRAILADKPAPAAM